jgi:uncharacterized protein (UPF0332 family)
VTTPHAEHGDPGRWTEGEETIEEMIEHGLLDSNIFANPTDVEGLFDDAEKHLDSAASLKDDDPRGAYSIMYTGTRKALVAALLKQGLRARGGEGGHRHVYDAIKAQLGTTASRIVDPFDRMRRKRNQADYDAGALIETADVEEDLPKAREIVTRVRTWSKRLGRF